MHIFMRFFSHKMINFKRELEDDRLEPLLMISAVFCVNKTGRKISLLYFGFLVLTIIGDLTVIAVTNQWSLFLTQYSIFGGGVFITLSCYLTMYHQIYIKMYWDMYHEVMPSFWDVRSLGTQEFRRFEKMSKIVNFMGLISIIIFLLCAVIAQPWFGDEYDLYYPVKVAVDHFNRWLLHPYLIIFYSLFFHIALTIIGNALCLTYVVLHLYNQFHMLNSRLKSLSQIENVHHVSNNQYQSFITEELISCLKHHQTLLDYAKRINNLLYYPIYFYTASGVITFISLIFLPKTESNIIRMLLPAVVAIIAAITFCSFGQLLENKSEETFTSAAETSWYLWNIKNMKLLQMLLFKSKENVVLSSSGLITINFELLIRLYQAIYSTVMFVINIGSNTPFE